MTIMEKVRHALKSKKEGSIVSARSLERIASRGAIDQTLSRLARAGEIIRISRGMYVVPVRGKFGSYPPSPEKVVRAYSKAKRKRIVPHGAVAANRLGLTTQQPIRQVYLTPGQPGRLELGTNPVEVRHAPEWQTILPNQPAGEAIRAMAYMGKERAKESAVKIRRVLGPAEWAKIKRARSRLPEWVVKAVEEAERVA